MNEIFADLDKVATLSTAAMVFAACIIVGYILRFIKKFPNDGIPIVVILNGALVFPLLVDSKSATGPMHAWIIRQIIAGAIVGFIAWMSHKFVISKVEDYLSSKFDVVARVLGSKPDTTTPPADPPKP